jgi:hypothetical protein
MALAEPVTRVCAAPNCDRAFETTRERRRYCSRRCASNGYAATNLRLATSPEHFAIDPATADARRYTSEGYITLIWRGLGSEAEHRLHLARMLGRPLRKGETAHHRNGIRDDNRPENLELWVTQQPAGQRASEQVCCPNCGHALRLLTA